MPDAIQKFEECHELYNRINPGQVSVQSLYALAFCEFQQGNFRKARNHAEQAKKQAEDRHVLLILAWVAAVQGDWEEAELCLEKVLKKVEEESTFWLINYASILMERGAYQKAQQMLDRAAILAEKTKDDGTIHDVILQQAWLELRLGQMEEGERMFKQTLDYSRSVNEQSLMISSSLLGLAKVHLWRKNFDLAREMLVESLRFYKSLQGKLGVTSVLRTFVMLETSVGRDEHATRLLGAESAWREQAGAVLGGPEQSEMEGYIEALRSRMGVEAYQQVMAEGQSLSLEEAAQLAIKGDLS